MNIQVFDKKVNMLYDYLYNDEFKENYEIKNIDIYNINESDIELPLDKNSNDFFNSLLKQNLQFLFNINDDIYFKIISDTISTIFKISFSSKSYNDNLMSYILSELILKNHTNGILLPIINFSVNLLDLKNLLSKINIPLSFETLLNNKKNKKIYIKIREGFYNLETLRIYINQNKKINYKLILFQIIHCLFKINESYKKFRHNNLNLDNIFIYTNKPFLSNKIKQNLFGNNYIIPNNSIQIKITNFEESIINDDNGNGDENGDENDNENDKIYITDHTEIITDIKNHKNENENIIFETNNNIIYDLINLAKDILKLNINLDLLTKNFLTKLKDMKKNDLENLNDDYFYNLNNDYFEEYAEKTNSQNFYIGKRILNNTNENNQNDKNKLINKKLIRINNKMNGGGEKTTVPPHNIEKNTPFRTNDEKSTFNKKQEDVVKPRQPPVLLEQTIYDTSTSKIQKQEPPPVYVPVYDTNGQSMAVPFASNMINPSLSQPIIKQYNVSLANPLHDFRTVSRIYEDIIPGDPVSFTFTTLYERQQLINFMRNLINTNTDGEDMIAIGGKNSLLSSIKMLDLNPYSISKTPYLDLARNFLIFRAAYPIRYNQEKNNVNIAKTSHGINVRIYNISLAEMISDNMSQNLSNFDFDMWRELHYYKYILDEIITKKKSPNFISYILYKKDKLSNINWSKLDTLQKNNTQLDINMDLKLIAYKKNTTDIKNITILFFKKEDNNDIIAMQQKLKIYPNINIINLNHNDSSYISLINKYNIKNFPAIIFKIDNNDYMPYNDLLTFDNIIKFINSSIIVLDNIIDLRKTSKESLILLTEAPHSNIIKWASPLYESSGALKKMLATGFHKKEVWESILFQIMHILYILQKEKIYFEELTLEKNIYIKDLYYDHNNQKYWIYNVDGLNYYVPNYGYLVLFDSKYSDSELFNYKIRSSNLFQDKNDKINNKNDIDYNFNYEQNIYDQFKNIFEPNIFISKLKVLGCLEPDTNILNLLRNIQNKNDIIEINLYIKEFFSKYLNNRIGKLLTISEKEKINILNRPKFNQRGELLVKQERYDEYKWVLYDKDDVGNMKKIINKNNDNMYINEICNSYSLLSYPQSEIINPLYIEENNIIETYSIKN